MERFEAVDRAAFKLPEVTESQARGLRTWKVSGRVFARERPLTDADLRRYGDEDPPSGPILSLRVEDLAEKEAVLQAGHAGVFTISRFRGYEAVLVQVDVIEEEVLQELFARAWLTCAPPEVARDHFPGQ